jgi:hypothetical protein
MTLILNNQAYNRPVVNRQPHLYPNGYVHARTSGIALQSTAKVSAVANGYLTARAMYYAAHNTPVQMSMF